MFDINGEIFDYILEEDGIVVLENMISGETITMGSSEVWKYQI